MFGMQNKCTFRTETFLLEPLEARTLLTGSGYEDRGWVSVIVDNTLVENINVQLDQFKQDLIGDSWRVSMHTDAPRMDDEHYVWRNESPAGPVTIETAEEGALEQYASEIATVKGMIADDAAAATLGGSQLKQVIIVGHVTVPYSGLAPYDGHWFRAFPTDLYYADLDGTPQTWGDEFWHGVNQSNNDVSNELTTNESGDGRFDADAVPGRDWLQYNASAEDVRDALNQLEALHKNGGTQVSFVTVTKSGTSPTPPARMQWSAACSLTRRWSEEFS